MTDPTETELSECLDGLDYPVEREELVRHAWQHGADASVVELLTDLPLERAGSPAEVDEVLDRADRR